jgi:hypothetical protein
VAHCTRRARHWQIKIGLLQLDGHVVAQRTPSADAFERMARALRADGICGR